EDRDERPPVARGGAVPAEAGQAEPTGAADRGATRGEGRPGCGALRERPLPPRRARVATLRATHRPIAGPRTEAAVGRVQAAGRTRDAPRAHRRIGSAVGSPASRTALR